MQPITKKTLSYNGAPPKILGESPVRKEGGSAGSDPARHGTTHTASQTIRAARTTRISSDDDDASTPDKYIVLSILHAWPPVTRLFSLSLSSIYLINKKRKQAVEERDANTSTHMDASLVCLLVGIAAAAGGWADLPFSFFGASKIGNGDERVSTGATLPTPRQARQQQRAPGQHL